MSPLADCTPVDQSGDNEPLGRPPDGDTPPIANLGGGALSAVRTQCNYLGVWPYYRPILRDTRGTIVTLSVFLILSPLFGDPQECRGDVEFPPSFGPPVTQG